MAAAVSGISSGHSNSKEEEIFRLPLGVRKLFPEDSPVGFSLFRISGRQMRFLCPFKQNGNNLKATRLSLEYGQDWFLLGHMVEKCKFLLK